MRWTARGGPLAGRAEEQRRLPERGGDQRRGHDRGVGQVGAEAVLRPEPAGQGREDLEVDLLLGTTAPADEVPVALGVGPEPPRYPVVEVRVGDVAELLEHLEVAVDGGGIDL